MKNHGQSVFTGTTASSTACRHGSTWRPRSQPMADRPVSPAGQTRFLRMWARPSCGGPEPRSPMGFCAPDPRTYRVRKRNADPKMESGKKVTTFNRCLPVEGRYSCILGSIIDVTSHSSVFGKLWSFACWGTLSDTLDSPFPDSYYTQIRRNINSQGC